MQEADEQEMVGAIAGEFMGRNSSPPRFIRSRRTGLSAPEELMEAEPPRRPKTRLRTRRPAPGY